MTDRSSKLIRNRTSEFLVVATPTEEQSTEACYKDETFLHTGKRGRLK